VSAYLNGEGEQKFLTLNHWEKLKVYWSKLETSKKVKKMSNARSMVKNLTNVGQIGKVGKEVHIASDFANDDYHHHLSNV
jgi:hypothetical protein